jgi:CheY-like chemotaxis protein
MEQEQRKINIMYFEDNPSDVVLIRDALADVRNVDFRIEHVTRLTEGLRRLPRTKTDIILLDLNLPDSEGLATFEEVKKVAGDIPIIIMSGLSDEDLSLRAVQQGAQDYLVKGQVDANLLIRTIRYGIERQKLLTDLRRAVDQIRTLEGLLPICCYCKGIRDERGFWQPLENYIKKHSDVVLSHGICPACADKHHSELYRTVSTKKNKKSST